MAAESVIFAGQTGRKPSLWFPGINWNHWLFRINELRDPPIHNLVGAWILNDGAGSIPIDLGPQKHQAVLNDPSLWKGREGILFNGAASIKVPSKSYGFNFPTDSGTSAEMTLITYCRFVSNTPAECILEAVTSAGINQGWLVTSVSSLGNKIRFRTRTSAGLNSDLEFLADFPLEGTLIATAHIETGNVDKRIYHNGVLKGSVTSSLDIKADITDEIRIASRVLAGEEMKGIVQFVIILNTMLTHEQVLSISIDPMAPFRRDPNPSIVSLSAADYDDPPLAMVC